MKTLLLLLSLSSLTLGGVLELEKFKSQLNLEYEGPRYNVLPNPVEGANFEIRQYLKANWTVNSYKATTIVSDENHSFMKLFHYISKGNTEGIKIPMTIPVLNYIGQRPCPYCEIDLKMMFYLPDKYQPNPPIPKDPTLEVQELPESIYYVRKFGGFAKPSDWYKQVDLLHKDLVSNNMTSVDKTSFFTAGYDSPFHFLKRRNEVWIKKL